MKKLLLSALIIILFCGCAKFPDNPSPVAGKRLIVTININGRVNPTYGTYLFVLNTEPIDNTKPQNSPIPVVAPPWGNGIAAGRYNYFVAWSSDFKEYRLYRCDPDNVQNYQYIGQPVFSVQPNIDPNAEGSQTQTLRFELLLSQVPMNTANDIENIRFNIIATDRWGNGISPQTSKRWDAMGNATSDDINHPVELDIRQDRIINNTTTGLIEPSGDVFIDNSENIDVPDLDIVDWQIEIRS